MASKRRNMFHKNKTQETTEKGMAPYSGLPFGLMSGPGLNLTVTNPPIRKPAHSRALVIFFFLDNPRMWSEAIGISRARKVTPGGHLCPIGGIGTTDLDSGALGREGARGSGPVRLEMGFASGSAEASTAQRRPPTSVSGRKKLQAPVIISPVCGGQRRQAWEELSRGTAQIGGWYLAPTMPPPYALKGVAA
ncbi:hypothetical protein AAG570_002257 [Ranatra chinensis]|uniref:Uncharacterized protein n=1 Tax=Ranatra chinensis TaxID=642074 RepID=A0ABD0Y6Z9_9HEMI